MTSLNVLLQKGICLFLGFFLLSGLRAQEGIVLRGNSVDLGVMDLVEATAEHQANYRPIKLIRDGLTPNIVVLNYTQDLSRDYCQLVPCDRQLARVLSDIGRFQYKYSVLNFERARELIGTTQSEEFFFDMDGPPLAHDNHYVDSVPTTVTTEEDYEISRSQNVTGVFQARGGNTFYVKAPVGLTPRREVILEGNTVNLGPIGWDDGGYRPITLVRTFHTPNIVVVNYIDDSSSPSYFVLNFEGIEKPSDRLNLILDVRWPISLSFAFPTMDRDISRSEESPYEFLIRRMEIRRER